MKNILGMTNSVYDITLILNYFKKKVSLFDNKRDSKF